MNRAIEPAGLKDLLTKHYAQRLFDEVDKIVIEKGITDTDYDELRNEHHRTKK
jgi:hypothetical protein